MLAIVVRRHKRKSKDKLCRTESIKKESGPSEWRDFVLQVRRFVSSSTQAESVSADRNIDIVNLKREQKETFCAK